MKNHVAPLPPGPRLISTLTVRDVGAALEFYTRAFDAREVFRMIEPGDLVGHAEMTLAGGLFKLGREWPEGDALGPDRRGGPTSSMTLYVEDVDASAARAVAAGATLERPAADQFYGDRVATVRDPFGHRWHIHTRIEELTHEEMQRRLTKLCAS